MRPVERIIKDNDYTCTPREASIMLGVDYTTVIYYIHKGLLPAKRPNNNKNYVIRLDDLNDFDQRRQESRHVKYRKIKRLADGADIACEIVDAPCDVQEEEPDIVSEVEYELALFDSCNDVAPETDAPKRMAIDEQIRDMKVSVPADSEMTVGELQTWLNGYIACQKAVLELISAENSHRN